MSDPIELRGFMGLSKVFKERNWSNPYFITIKKIITGDELLIMLEIEKQQVEIIFVNGKAFLPSDAVIHSGDRVALVPPGTPGPYRVLLGFVKKE